MKISTQPLARSSSSIPCLPQPKSAAAYPRSSTRESAGSSRCRRRNGSCQWASPRAEKMSMPSVPTIGRIGMTNTIVDVTDLPQVAVGDIAVFDINPLFVDSAVPRRYIDEPKKEAGQ